MHQHASTVSRPFHFYRLFLSTKYTGGEDQAFPVFHRSSTPEHYCEHKGKVKTGEVWERGYHHAACECTLDNVPYFL